VRPF